MLMIVSTTTALDGTQVSEYVGVVTGEAVLGANAFRDLFAGLRDIVGGRSAGYERSLREARDTAIAEMVSEAEQKGADGPCALPNDALADAAAEAVREAVSYWQAIAGT